MKLYKYRDNNKTYYKYGSMCWSGRGSASASYAYVAKKYLIDKSIKNSINSLKKIGA